MTTGTSKAPAGGFSATVGSGLAWELAHGRLACSFLHKSNSKGMIMEGEPAQRKGELAPSAFRIAGEFR